jgi:hypothetical protein
MRLSAIASLALAMLAGIGPHREPTLIVIGIGTGPPRAGRLDPGPDGKLSLLVKAKLCAHCEPPRPGMWQVDVKRQTPHGPEPLCGVERPYMNHGLIMRLALPPGDYKIAITLHAGGEEQDRVMFPEPIPTFRVAPAIGSKVQGPPVAIAEFKSTVR